MGKLLHHVESFNWIDKALNRSSCLQNYNIALTTAREYEDDIYCPETMYNPSNLNNIFLFMWTNGYQSHEQLQVHFNWLTADDFQLLLSLHYIMGYPTPNSSNSWIDFANEFLSDNYSLIGLKDNFCTSPLIFDKASLNQFHSDYAASFDINQQKDNFKYFKKHYKPILKIPIGQIKFLITRNQVNAEIIRVDPAKTDPNGLPIHGQQIHVHLKIGAKEYALNLDGTWKHPLPKTSTNRIPVDICLTLSHWGFCLPIDYY